MTVFASNARHSSSVLSSDAIAARLSAIRTRDWQRAQRAMIDSGTLNPYARMLAEQSLNESIARSRRPIRTGR